MIFSTRIFCAFQLAVLASVGVLAQEIPAPPPALPIVYNHEQPRKAAAASLASGPVQFSIGDPTDEEQFYLELINRARTNAAAESLRLLALPDAGVKQALELVDTNLLKTQFAAIPSVPPLSFNAQLIEAARGQTEFQFENALQTHTNIGNFANLTGRFSEAGYSFRAGGENVFSYAKNVEYGHAGFEVDWNGGTDDGGMQNPPGHRENIHNAIYTEVGIGIVKGNNTVVTTNADETRTTNSVGPMLVTQDFGLPATAATYITGVAYYDLNGNDFYDIGEGLGGVMVTVDGQDAFAITSASGGYSVPVPPGGTYTVHFQSANMNAVSAEVTLDGANNYKLDFKPAYLVADVLAAPSITFAGVPNLYMTADLGGATAYRARTFALQTPVLEGAENGLTNVTTAIFGDYPVISTTVHAHGHASFHLGHRSGLFLPGLQSVQLNPPYYVKPNATVNFSSRVAIASSDEVASISVSKDEGATWTVIWSQAGNNENGLPDLSEKNFSPRSASLADFAGQLVLIRFDFTVAGSYYPLPANSDPGISSYGWFFDDISFVNAEQASDPIATDLGSDPVFRFIPPTTGDYLAQFQSENGARSYPWGALRLVTAEANPPVISLLASSSISNGLMNLRFTVLSGTVTPFALDSASTILGPWSQESAATFIGPELGRYGVTVPVNGSARFYRVRAN